MTQAVAAGTAALALAAAVLASGPAVPASGAVAPARTSMPVCPSVAAGDVRCLALVVTDAQGAPVITATPSGYAPLDLQHAYRLPSATAGGGQTVGIVDAYDDPNAMSDLAVYRSHFGLPPCTTSNGCFRKVNQSGGTRYPKPNAAWAQEISLDLDMVSAVCPNCHILLVEASVSSQVNLGSAVNEAVKLGAATISTSYVAAESSLDPTYDSTYYNHPGVAITAATSDSGYGVRYPAASRYVTAVGGTSLSRSTTGRGWSETAWSAGGSGCSKDDPKPTWQKDAGCATRTVADVAAEADPNPGVAAYDTYLSGGWLVFGGTSVSSALTAGVYALAGNARSTRYGSYPYSHSGSLFDITSGANGSCSPAYLCTAGPGYDGPTGLGSPNGTGAF